MKMETGLPINLADILHHRSVESTRVEYKSTWNDKSKSSVIRTICAFANDLYNQNGGYVIIGVVEDDNGNPILPPKGVEQSKLDIIQKEIIGACKGLLVPEYIPLIFLASYTQRDLIIIWCPAGDNRPYSAPKRSGKGMDYYIRSGNTTIEAQGDLKRQLLEQAAKIPFDDRRNHDAKVEDISFYLVKKHLENVRSYLTTELESFDKLGIYHRLRLLIRMDGYEVPRNFALLFFNESPEQFFPGAYIEVVQFDDDAGGDLIEEKQFRGPLPEQINSTLKYLEGLGGTLVHKIPNQAEAKRTVPYPYEAMEEAIVNAVYHRSYEDSQEPVKVYLYPNRMEITSYPGPVSGIKLEHLEPNSAMPAVPARNRRIGELLKELRLAEGRGTGIPKIHRRMAENGSPQARFDFDENRTYFRVILPVHPKYQTLHSLREATHLWAIGYQDRALEILKNAFNSQPSSAVIASQLIEYLMKLEQLDEANKVFNRFKEQPIGEQNSQPYLVYAKELLDLGIRKKMEDLQKKAKEVLNSLPAHPESYENIVSEAILRRRTRNNRQAHKLFEKAYALNPDDPKLLHEFAQTKMDIARNWRLNKDIRRKLTREAIELFRQVIQLTDDRIRKAWCWYNLAKALNWMREPVSNIEEAYKEAISLHPDNEIILQAYNNWKDAKGKSSKKPY